MSDTFFLASINARCVQHTSIKNNSSKTANN